MKFYEIVEQALTLLRREGRVSYRALKREFDLDDEYIEDLKAEIVEAKHLAVDEDGKVLVWVGAASVASLKTPTLHAPRTEGERRQLTVMFCDLVGSTALSEQLDPEEWREVVRAYQTTCAEVISRFEGYIAQYLGDGLLVYFGFPAAHEDDAARAVRAGLGIVEALQPLPSARYEVPSPARGEETESVNIYTPHPNLPPQGGKEKSLQVRIGIHTGLVVVGEMGGGSKREQLALGDTPNIAARIQGLAETDTVVISAATYRLVQGLFDHDALGPQTLKGISTPLALYRVMKESDVQSRFDATVRAGLTPLVGREEELELLRAHWKRAKAGHGQIILLSGEPGIGKSRLLQELKDAIARDDGTRIEFRCSPYYQHTAFYPVIDHLQRLLQFTREDSPQERLAKLEHLLQQYSSALQDTLPLLAALLSLPHPESYPSLNLTPQKQRQRTQEALWHWLAEEAERKPVLAVWEDLHWADPSTLELHRLFMDHMPMTQMFTILTARPEFTPPWEACSWLTTLTLVRLGQEQVETMVEQITGGKKVPREVLQQVVQKTDGVPLFVEELTKTILELGMLKEQSEHYELTRPLPPLAIPATLQDSLMARLDRLSAVREVVQLGATLGREFSYELLQAVSPVEESVLRYALAQLLEAEILYQHGLPSNPRYVFKHALLQDAAYQSLLKNRRQQYHTQIAQVLEKQFPETTETQPELVAHHYTEAGLSVQAILYWQKAGQRAIQRSANAEAINQLTRGLELLGTLPDTPERTQQELTLQISLGPALMIAKGFAVLEVEKAYTRALALCQMIGETPHLFPILHGLCRFYFIQGKLQRGRELGEQLLSLAQSEQNSVRLMWAHGTLGEILVYLGEFALGRAHTEQGVALYDPQKRVGLGAANPKATHLTLASFALWCLGYPEQALKTIHEAITLAKELSHSFTLTHALVCAAYLHHYRREESAVQEWAEATIALASDQGFPFYSAMGTIFRGWALAKQGRAEEGIAQIHQGMAAFKATGAEVFLPYFLVLLAESYGESGQVEEGLNTLAEALDLVEKTGERRWEVEAYRLKGELVLQAGVGGLESQEENQKAKMVDPRPLPPDPQSEAESCFLKAIEISRKQQAKSLELRAVMSLSRLWQQQGKTAEARKILADIYEWFTEGFDTRDLQEAKVLLDSLGVSV